MMEDAPWHLNEVDSLVSMHAVHTASLRYSEDEASQCGEEETIIAGM